MSGASKFHTWKFSWFERLIYVFAPHGKSEPSDSDELGKATCVTNTRVTEYSVNHLFLHPFTCSTLPFEKKLHPFDLTVRKNFASVYPFDLTVRKKFASVQPFDLTVQKKFASIQPLNPAVRKKFASVSYPFACRAFSCSNGCRKERFCVRGHKYLFYKKHLTTVIVKERVLTLPLI